jgi:hypothetical protein
MLPTMFAIVSLIFGRAGCLNVRVWDLLMDFRAEVRLDGHRWSTIYFDRAEGLPRNQAIPDPPRKHVFLRRFRLERGVDARQGTMQCPQFGAYAAYAI